MNHLKINDRHKIAPGRLLIIGFLASVLLGGVGALSVGDRTPSILYADIYLLMLCFLFLLRFFMYESKIVVDRPLLILSLLYILVHLLSIMINGSDLLKGLLSIKIFVGGVLIYFIVLSFIKKDEDTGWIIYSLVFFATALSILLIIKYTVGYDESDNLTKDMVDIGWGRSNYLASFLAFFIPISLGLTISEKVLTTRVIFTGCFLLMLLTLVITMSKGAGLSLAIVLFIVLPLLLKTKAKIQYLLTLSLIIVCAYYLTPKIVPESLITMNTQYIEYRFVTPDYARIRLLQTSWDDFIENPLLGIGPYESKSLSSKYEVMPHNFIAQLFAELGFLGAMPFMLIIFVFLFRAYKNCSYSGKAEDYFILAGVIGTLIHGLFELTFQGAQYMSIFWVLMATVTLKYRQSRANFHFRVS